LRPRHGTLSLMLAFADGGQHRTLYYPDFTTSNHDQAGSLKLDKIDLYLIEEPVMNTVGKAIWFIETHLTDDLSLGQIAGVAGVSRYHMERAFGFTTGQSVMRYVRARRLSEAARALASGAPDILMVALDAGYGSHEAFTRAFRDRFGLTPETVRDRRHIENLLLMEPLKMDETPTTNLQPPRQENGRALLIAGLGDRYTWETNAGIPTLWQRLNALPGGIPNQIKGSAYYGVCCNSDDAGNFDYVAGTEVTDFSSLPSELSRVRIPEQTYLVFTHADHVATIRGTIASIWNTWLPTHGIQVADGQTLSAMARISTQRREPVGSRSGSRSSRKPRGVSAAPIGGATHKNSAEPPDQATCNSPRYASRIAGLHRSSAAEPDSTTLPVCST
jgi:AraC family transcriptional regulator